MVIRPSVSYIQYSVSAKNVHFGPSLVIILHHITIHLIYTVRLLIFTLLFMENDKFEFHVKDYWEYCLIISITQYTYSTFETFGKKNTHGHQWKLCTFYFIAINIPYDRTLKLSSLVLGHVWKRQWLVFMTIIIHFVS